MAVDIPLDLDSGPIVWVKAELDATLLSALDGIGKLQSGGDVSLSNSVRADLHRAGGAFELVGVEGFAALLREFEAHFPAPPQAPKPEALQTISSACRRLISHLEEVAVGAQPVPLRFLPEYMALGQLRDIRFGPADLFYPDLSRKPRFLSAIEEVPAASMASYLLRHRRDFQRGFLDWLRNTQANAGIATMRQALAGIEQTHPMPAQRSFWWATAALLDAVKEQKVESSTAIKQLFARIDLQIRRLVEGSTKVADRLKREVLYHVARADAGVASCDDVKALYSLDVLVPKRIRRELDIVSLRPAIDTLNEIVGRCKESWSAFSANRAGAAERLVGALGELPPACDAIGVKPLSELGAGLASVTPQIGHGMLKDDASLEFASALLLLETAMQHLSALPKTFAAEVAGAVQRLQYASAQTPLPAELRDVASAGTLSRIAQERETVAQVCREIRTNMRSVEMALDAVFRDRTAVEDLAQVPGLLSQVSGALRLLGWDDAFQAIARTSERVSALTANPTAVTQEEIDRLANAIAGFGFYVDARERKESHAEQIIESVERTLSGESLKVASTNPESSVELALDTRIRGLKHDLAQLQGGALGEASKSALVAGLNDVRRDAELLDDPQLARAAKSGLNILATDAPDLDQLKAELAPVLGVQEAQAPVSTETQRILDATPAGQDDALLQIFIEEADEVVTNIDLALSEYAATHRHELLVDIRRGYHTLKGSGRMVGLVPFGDAAWSIEKLMNAALEAEEAVLTPAKTEHIANATKQFRKWVDELKASGACGARADAFDALVAKWSDGKHETKPSAPSEPLAVRTAAPEKPTEIVFDAPTAPPRPKQPDFVELGLAAAGTAGVGAFAFAKAAPSSAADTFVASVPKAPEAAALDTPLASPAPLPTTEALDFDFLRSTPSVSLEALPEVQIDAAALRVFTEQPQSDIITPPPWNDELEVDGVRVSRTLFSIMGDEARSHLATLDQELTFMQFDPQLPPSAAIIRASHTLCGIHRTAGFVAVGGLANQLEEALLTIRRSRRSDDSLMLISNSVETLRAAVLRLQAQLPSTPHDRETIATATAQLQAYVAESGGDLGDAAAEIARASAADEDDAVHAIDVPSVAAPDDSWKPSESAPAQFSWVNADTAATESAPPVDFAPRLQEIPTSPDFTRGTSDKFSIPMSPIAAPSASAPVSASTSLFAAGAGLGLGAAAFMATAPAVGNAPATASPPPEPAVSSPLGASATIEPAASAAMPLEATSLASDSVSEAALPTSSKTSEPIVAPQPAAPELKQTLAAEAPPPVPTTAVPVLPAASSVSVPIDMRSAASFAATAPAVQPVASGEDPLIGVNDDIDAQVLPIFLEEAQELFPAASSQIRELRASPEDGRNVDSLKRTLHTLKGSARMAGAMRLGELTHIVESALGEKPSGHTASEIDRVEESFDDVAYVLDALIAGKYDVVLPRYATSPAPNEDQADQTENVAVELEAVPVRSELSAVVAAAASAPAATEKSSSVATSIAGLAGATALTTAAARFAAAPAAAAATTTASQSTAQDGAVAFLRVRTDSVELLADEAGEIAINRSRIESELRSLKASLVDLTSFVARLRTQLREIEIQGESQIQSRLDNESTFDPLEFDRFTRFQELTRGLAEGVNDVATVQQNLLKNIDDAETALAAQTRLSRSVQLRLQSLRTVPFSSVSERLYRVLRQTAKDVGKRANLEIAGGRIEIDRGVLERLIPVLEHLLRNSFAHGIEAPDERRTAGKEEIGDINIAVKQQGNEVAIVFSDDGRGIALERVRQRAIATGLAEETDILNDAQLIEFIFRPGFSTADSITNFAGRGVGMDVVRSELAALGGRVVAATTAGVGTSFTLSVPLTLAVTQVLLVEIAGVVYAIPSSLIETVRQVPQRERTVSLAAKQIDLAGKLVPYRSMAVLLGGMPDATSHKTYSVAIVRVGDAVAAIEIDRVIGNQEVVAKPYGPQLARLPGMAGLTVLGNGQIVLLMDPLALLRATASASDSPKPVPLAAVPDVAASAATEAMPSAPTPASTPASVEPPSAARAADNFDSWKPVPALEDIAPAAPALEVAAAPLAPIEARPLGASITAQPPVLVPFVSPVATPPEVVLPPAVPVEPEMPAVIPRLPIVLVVDDSLTVRKITSRLLERENYKALTAKDGLDALQVLADVNPDVILLDIEMPRMDGFEFTKTIKSDNRQNNIPIIMITSRTAEKHRNHAKELGVEEYIGKPYQDDQLLALIQKYTAHVVRPN